MTPSRVTRLPVLAAALVVLAAGCGDDEDGRATGIEGGPEDWARAVCGEEAEVEQDGEEHQCTVEGDGASQWVTSYVVEGEDPEDELGDEADGAETGEGLDTTSRSERLDDDRWAVVTIQSPGQVQTGLLDRLADVGFDR